MKVAGEILDRMSELKSFYNDISKNATDRETYNHEFHELQKELNSLKSQKLKIGDKRIIENKEVDFEINNEDMTFLDKIKGDPRRWD